MFVFHKNRYRSKEVLYNSKADLKYSDGLVEHRFGIGDVIGARQGEARKMGLEQQMRFGVRRVQRLEKNIKLAGK